jgi:cell division protein FtsL
MERGLQLSARAAGVRLRRASPRKDPGAPAGEAGPAGGRGESSCPECAPARLEESIVRRLGDSKRVAIAVGALLASLSVVTWRQMRVLEALEELYDVRQEIEVISAAGKNLLGEIQYLESRGRVVPEARERLGMHNPAADEIVYLSGVNQ